MTAEELDELDRMFETATAPDPECSCAHYETCGRHHKTCQVTRVRQERRCAEGELVTTLRNNAGDMLRLARLGMRRELEVCGRCRYRDKDVQYCVRNQNVMQDEEHCSRFRAKEGG